MSQRRSRKSLKRKAVEVAGWRLVRAVPYIGTVAAIGMVGYDVRKKGLVKGILNSGLDAIPFVGLGKNVIEYFTGDFFPDEDRRERHGADEDGKAGRESQGEGL
jgi:hypothetical protein